VIGAKIFSPDGSLSMFSDLGCVRDSRQETFGFNAKSAEFGDMIKAGVIDLPKVIPGIAESRLYDRTDADHRTLDRKHLRKGNKWPPSEQRTAAGGGMY
jgi:hypothetical protein